MIKFAVARYKDDNYENFLGTSIDNKYETSFAFDSNGSSIYEKYNFCIDDLISRGLQDTDIVAFCHGDVKILDHYFEDKILYVFDMLPTLGVAGIIGSTKLLETCGWWLSDKSVQRGHLIQWIDNVEANKYHMIKSIGNYNDICVVDGLCMFIKGELLKKLKFDSVTYPNSYNFYDYDYCLEAKALGYQIGVFDILLEHRSSGAGIYQDDWKSNKQNFIQKWMGKGYTFPIGK